MRGRRQQEAHRQEERRQKQERQLTLKEARRLLRLNRNMGDGRLLRKNYEM
jgi:hypothetical protein